MLSLSKYGGMDAVSQYALAYALTTSAGIRALLPLAAVSIAAHNGWIHPSGDFAWLGHALVMWILISVAALEILADKIPFVDHAMHFVQVASKPAAAVILVGGTMHAQSHEQLVFLMVIGALNALGIHGAVMGARAASTAGTAGLANPVLSTVEDTGSIGGIVLAFFAPVVAAVLALVFTVLLILVGRHVYRRIRPRPVSP
ncbi:MAG: DUF4126 domain-containing protein [Candidatus Eremiobacteraeota bacterium]|nr:DUF4126 domain-containing protein [Candidatus Eremiobacteraeota bacterium]